MLDGLKARIGQLVVDSVSQYAQKKLGELTAPKEAPVKDDPTPNQEASSQIQLYGGVAKNVSAFLANAATAQRALKQELGPLSGVTKRTVVETVETETGIKTTRTEETIVDKIRQAELEEAGARQLEKVLSEADQGKLIIPGIGTVTLDQLVALKDTPFAQLIGKKLPGGSIDNFIGIIQSRFNPTSQAIDMGESIDPAQLNALFQNGSPLDNVSGSGSEDNSLTTEPKNKIIDAQPEGETSNSDFNHSITMTKFEANPGIDTEAVSSTLNKTVEPSSEEPQEQLEIPSTSDDSMEVLNWL